MQIVVAGKLVFIERRKYFKSIYHFKIHMPVLVFALIIFINSLLFVSHWESFSRIAISVLLSRHLQAHTCSIVFWEGTDFLHCCPDKLPKIIILDTCIRYANQSIYYLQTVMPMCCGCRATANFCTPWMFLTVHTKIFLLIKEWFEL